MIYTQKNPETKKRELFPEIKYQTLVYGLNFFNHTTGITYKLGNPLDFITDKVTHKYVATYEITTFRNTDQFVISKYIGLQYEGEIYSTWNNKNAINRKEMKLFFRRLKIHKKIVGPNLERSVATKPNP